MNMIKSKRGQAAIEFLMTYGWMLLVVLIVGALIFSFVDFSSLLPNKLDLNNNLRGYPSDSIAYSNAVANGADRNEVKAIFSYLGAKQGQIRYDKGTITTILGDVCTSIEVRNLDTNTNASSTSGTTELPFLNGQTGMMIFNCSNVQGNTGLIKNDVLEGNLVIKVRNPKTDLEIPSTGSIRLQIAQ